MTMNTPARRLAPTLAIGIALIVSGCNAQDQGAATEPAAVQDQFEMVNIADAIFVLGFLFSMGLEPPAPGPDVCGPDPDGVALDCSIQMSCP